VSSLLPKWKTSCETTLFKTRLNSGNFSLDNSPFHNRHQRKEHVIMNGEHRGYRDLKVYKLAYKLAMDIFEVTKSFPPEEKYSLTDQIRKSSRSVAANIAEAWKRRQYPKMFISKTIDSASEGAETEVWLDFSKDCGYLDESKYNKLVQGYDEVNRMLFGMVIKPDRFILK
jgi:four helix bundle protein